MIQWNKYFDHIFVLSRCSNFERRQKLNYELMRIGLYDYVTYLYQPDSQLLDYNNSCLDQKNYRCKYAHYSCIKMAYELGYDNICILEDDMTFLKDLSEIESQLIAFLENKDKSDIYLFDYAINNDPKLTTSLTYYLADFYWINIIAMKFIIHMLETYPDLMNDSMFFSDLSDANYNCFYIYPGYGTKGIYVDLSQTNLLPININVSEKRICIQATNDVYRAFNNFIDISLYNL